jgi:hypothetical protein
MTEINVDKAIQFCADHGVKLSPQQVEILKAQVKIEGEAIKTDPTRSNTAFFRNSLINIDTAGQYFQDHQEILNLTMGLVQLENIHAPVDRKNINEQTEGAKTLLANQGQVGDAINGTCREVIDVTNKYPPVTTPPNPKASRTR